MQRVKITSDGMGIGTRVTTMDGMPIPGIVSLDIKPIRAGEANTVELEVFLPVLDVEAWAFMSFESCCEVAAHYGYRMVPLDA